MILTSFPARWLRASPLTGPKALLFAAAALAVPSLIRFSVDGIVSGAAFGTFVPFVVLAALVLSWPLAALVAVAAAAIVDFEFVTPYGLLQSASDLFSVGLFLISSALIIALVAAARGVCRSRADPDLPAESPCGIIFSLEDGEALASWPGAEAPVRLGPQQEVAGMMEEFLAQLEVGKRLSRQCGIPRASADPVRPEWATVGQEPG